MPKWNFDNMEDFMKWAKAQKPCTDKWEEVNEVTPRKYVGDVEVDPSSLFECVHGQDGRVMDLQMDFKSALDKYLNVVNFVEIVKKEIGEK